MDSKRMIYILACLILAVSTVSALNCIQCSMYLDYNDNTTSSSNDTTTVAPSEERCDKKSGPGVPCKEGEVCTTQYNPDTKMLMRSCEKEDICKNTPKNYNCSTCSTDLCGNSGLQIHPVYAPLVAGLLFATLGR